MGSDERIDAVDGGMVCLLQQRVAARCHALDVVEALDDVHLPQRPAEVELARVEASRLDAQLAPVAWLGQGDVANVELEVEVAVLDPVRVVEVHRHLHQLLTEDPREVQATLDVLEDPLERHGAVRCRRGVVDRETGDVHGGVRRFEVDERGVEAGQLLHDPPIALPPYGV